MACLEKKCDVLVVGGGVAGVAAAVKAARDGAHTVLIEKKLFLGGAAVIGLHRFICGLYANGRNIPGSTLNKGIATEIYSRLKGLAPDKSVRRMGKVYVLPYAIKDLISVFQSLINNESNLDILYNAHAISVISKKNAITSVTVQISKNRFDIIPRAVVDCSGEGIIVRLSGAPYEVAQLHQRQLSGYGFRVKGLQGADDLTAIKVPYYLSRAVAESKMPFYLKFTTFASGDYSDEGYCKLNIPPSNERDRNEKARDDALLAHQYLTQMLPEFRKSAIVEISPEVADREGPRICGEYMLSADDVLSARKFTDGVVKNAWPIELWDQKKGPCFHYLDPGDYYEIPLRCLIPQGLKNCYCAGRCISVSREALGSTRVMGTCISLGEQAGRAAAYKVN